MFSIWGTVIYGIAAIFSIVAVFLIAFFGWTPPSYFISVAFIYTFMSTGIICMGRIETNKEARFFIHALKKRSEQNKQRQMRKMN